MKTESEKQFEFLCRDLGWRFATVPLSNSNTKGDFTPDYDLYIGEYSLVVEIKEITRDRSASASRKIQDAVQTGFTRNGREALRRKIERAAPQVKKRAQGVCPSIIVVYDQAKPNSRSRTSPQNFLAAMYGWPIMRFTARSRTTIVHTSTEFSPWKKFTPHSNTSVSALAALWIRPDGLLALDVFHNVYAKSALAPLLIEHPRISQFTIRPSGRRFSYWVPVDIEG